MEELHLKNILLSFIQILFYIFCARALIIYPYRWFFSPLSSLPGPFLAKFTDWYAAYHSGKGQLHVRTLEAHEKYGPVFRQGPNKVVFNTTTALHQIYTSNDVQKSKAYAVLLPKGKVFNTHNCIDKRVHRFKRKVLMQGLSDHCLREMEPSMNEQIDKFVSHLVEASSTDGWSDPINMTERCKYLGYDIMAWFAFGASFELQDKPHNRCIVNAIQMSNKVLGVSLQFPELIKAKLHVFFFLKAVRMRQRFLGVIMPIIKSRVEAGKNAQNDLFNYIVDAKDEDSGLGFTKEELWTEARLMLIAGSDTSSTTMAAFFFYMSRYPKVHKQLIAEIRKTFASPEEIHSGQKLNSCIYLRACIEETLRLTPPIGGTLWREVSPGTGGMVIDGISIPEGTTVGVSAYAIHHNEDYFPNPSWFAPERWIVDGIMTKERVELFRSAFTPFSLGTRRCAGMNMAYMELSNTIAKTLRHFDFKAPDGPEREIGAGKPGWRGRENPKEFQLSDHLVSNHDGPYLQWKIREGLDKSMLLRG